MTLLVYKSERRKKMKTDLKNVTRGLRKGTVRHTPQILIGLGIAGMVTATVLAVRATPKALQLIEEEIERKNEEEAALATQDGYEVCQEIEELKPLEAVKVCWSSYIPAILVGTASTICLIGANSINTRRMAMLTTAYKLSETALLDYKNAVIETIGEKKEHEVKEKVYGKKLTENPVETKEIFITKKGNTLCYDSFTGRYFESDIEQINRAINILNRRMTLEFYISLNDFYEEIGLETSKLGNILGWNSDWGLLEIEKDAMLASDGRPCLVIDFVNPPKYDYSCFSHR